MSVLIVKLWPGNFVSGSTKFFLRRFKIIIWMQRLWIRLDASPKWLMSRDWPFGFLLVVHLQLPADFVIGNKAIFYKFYTFQSGMPESQCILSACSSILFYKWFICRQRAKSSKLQPQIFRSSPGPESGVRLLIKITSREFANPQKAACIWGHDFAKRKIFSRTGNCQRANVSVFRVPKPSFVSKLSTAKNEQWCRCTHLQYT